MCQDRSGSQPDEPAPPIFIPVTNAIERLHEEFKRRIKTQCLLPCAETACMLFWALLASGQITLRRVDAGTRCMSPPPTSRLTSPLNQMSLRLRRARRQHFLPTFGHDLYSDGQGYCPGHM